MEDCPILANDECAFFADQECQAQELRGQMLR
jgi:hypothetical protein